MFQKKQIARERAELKFKGKRPKADSLTSFANAQVQIARAQAEGIQTQHKKVLSEVQKQQEITTILDRLRRLSQK